MGCVIKPPMLFRVLVVRLLFDEALALLVLLHFVVVLYPVTKFSTL